MFAVIPSLPDRPSLEQVLSHHLVFQLLGVAVVLASLYVLYLICALIGLAFRRPMGAPAAPPAPAPAAPVAASPSETAAAASRVAAAEAELAAVIAAAVAVVLQRPHRVLDIHKIAPANQWLNAWAIEGRFQHFTSHRVR